MARKKTIPEDVREQVVALVEQFNEENSLPPASNPLQKVLEMFGINPPSGEGTGYRTGDYVPRFKGQYLYLDRVGFGGRLSEICRLKWTGDMNNWDFAIYRHSKNRYDPDEWMFPGAGEVDGTVTGAMRAGMAAYPP